MIVLIIYTALIGFSLISAGFLLGYSRGVDHGCIRTIDLLHEQGYLKMKGDQVLKYGEND